MVGLKQLLGRSVLLFQAGQRLLLDGYHLVVGLFQLMGNPCRIHQRGSGQHQPQPAAQLLQTLPVTCQSHRQIDVLIPAPGDQPFKTDGAKEGDPDP